MLISLVWHGLVAGTSLCSKHVHAGRVNGAVTFPVPVPDQVAAGLQAGPLASLLGAAGIRSAIACHAKPCRPASTDLPL